MKESPNKRAVIVGIFVLVGLSFLIAGILVIGNLRNTFSRKMHVTALFNDVNGLQQGNNIWFSGVKIGTVKNVKFFGDSQVRVVLNIDVASQQYIRKDAKVKVSTDGFIGNKILVIYGGTARSAAIEDGDTLSVEKTFSAEDMINTLQENNSNILSVTNDLRSVSHRLAKGEGTVGRLLQDETLYQNMAATSQSLRDASERARTLLNQLAVFGTQLNKKGTLANDLVSDTLVMASLRASMANLNRSADTAALFLSGLRRAATDPSTPVGLLLNDREAGAHLKATFKNLEASSKKLDEDLEGLQHSFPLRRYFKKKRKETTPP